MFTPKIIAKVKSDFPSKFGVPRQSGIVKDTKSYVVFEKQYRNKDALRGIEGFSHLWLIWYFDKAEQKEYAATVRPPKLGGNTRIGVFASRSPFRPNPIGLSLVKLDGVIEYSDGNLMLEVSGADLIDGTPVLDIKPYLPFVESVSNAVGGYTKITSKVCLYVDFPTVLSERIDEDYRKVISDLLSQDPRPGYQNDPERVYGMTYGRYDIKFKVDGNILTVVDVEVLK